jgi:lipopolysaccharide export system permease protein
MARRIDRYVLRELVKPFAFFLVVFTGIVWLTQSLRVIETIINSGQGAGVFAQFVLLLLPTIMSVVVPVSAFAATLYAMNRLFTESELVVMAAAGMSDLALVRPVAAFGALAAVATAAATIGLAPLAEREMRDRVHELRADIANALVFEGRFLHPANGLTIYVRENRNGDMSGVFVHDRRDPATEITYTARRAVLGRSDGAPRLLMLDGAAQRLDVETRALSVLDFESLVFDLSQFMDDPSRRRVRPSELFLTDLVAPTPETLALSSRGRLVAEGHEQIVSALYALALPMAGLAALLRGGYTRRGYARRIAGAVAAGVALRTAGYAAKAAVSGAADLWPLMYAPPVAGVLWALWSLSRGGARAALPARVGIAPT